MEKHKEIIDELLPWHPRFEVPDGYFSSLPGRIMARIDGLQTESQAKQPKFSLKVMRRYVAAAACVAVMGVGVTAILSKQGSADEAENKTVATTGKVPIDQMADYMMLDNDDIYAILAE